MNNILYTQLLIPGLLLLVLGGGVLFFLIRFLRKPQRRELALAVICINFLMFAETYVRVIGAPVGRLLLRIEDVLTKGENLEAFSVSDLLQQKDAMLSRIIIAVAIGGLTYYFFRFIRNKASEIPRPVAENKTVFLLNVVITSVLAFSLFLVISVFIAIPYLDEIKRPSVYTESRLDSTLRDRKKAEFPSLPGLLRDSAFSVKGYINEDSAISRLPRQVQETMLDDIARIQRAYELMMAQRSRVIKELSSFANGFAAREENFRGGVVNRFSVTAQNITADRALCYQNAMEVFAEFRRRALVGYDNAITEINTQDDNNNFLIEQIASDMRLRIAAFAKMRHDTTRILADTNRMITPYFFNYRSAGYYDYEPYMEAVTRDGSDWGFFGLMSFYLIKTKSTEMVLLIGMLGFGLLGASLLSFQRMQDGKNMIESFYTTPLIPDFGSVLTRGFGAALIVYLATKGGLAVFSMGATSDPNGYMLLLTCFIAALYSDKIWAYVSTKLVPGGSGGTGGTGGGGASGAGGGSTPAAGSAPVPA